MIRGTFAAILLAGACPAFAQSAIERHVWQDARTFEPVSRTATMFTGAITLNGHEAFAELGRKLVVEFEKGPTVVMSSAGAFDRTWTMNGGRQTGEMFEMNLEGLQPFAESLCGEGEEAWPLYAVFAEDQSLSGALQLHLAVFRSPIRPVNIDSRGLCATFTYE